jgi:hypothetical protein
VAGEIDQDKRGTLACARAFAVQGADFEPARPTGYARHQLAPLGRNVQRSGARR